MQEHKRIHYYAYLSIKFPSSLNSSPISCCFLISVLRMYQKQTSIQIINGETMIKTIKFESSRNKLWIPISSSDLSNLGSFIFNIQLFFKNRCSSNEII